MGITAFFLLALSVYSVSAWGSYHGWGSQHGWGWEKPECFEFQSWQVWGLNYTSILNDVKGIDGNSDGVVTFAEFAPPQPVQPDPNNGAPAGLPRCMFIMDQVARNGIDRDTANYLYDILDTNGDNILNAQDNNATTFNQADVNMDGNVSVCELMGQFVRMIEDAQRRQEDIQRDIDAISGPSNDDWYGWDSWGSNQDSWWSHGGNSWGSDWWRRR